MKELKGKAKEDFEKWYGFAFNNGLHIESYSTDYFYNPDIAQSITLQGQEALKEAIKKAVELINK